MDALAPGHLIPLLIVAALLFFGWKQLPDMARSAGKSLRVFRTEVKGLSEDVKGPAEPAATAPAATANPAATTTPAATATASALTPEPPRPSEASSASVAAAAPEVSSPDASAKPAG